MNRTTEPVGRQHAQLGLTREQVAQRVAAGLSNRISQSSTRSLWQIVRANVFTLFNAIVAGCFTLLLVLGQWQDALFGFSALGNAMIGVVQEYRAKRTLDRLAVITTPHTRVLREGTVQEIEVSAVVHDDVLVLRAGDQVPADATMLTSERLEVDESLLTGESRPVSKPVGTDVFSGSGVVAGTGRARVTRVGADSYSNQLTAEAKRFSLVNSELRNGLNRVLRWITWALVPVMAIVVNAQMQTQGGWVAALTNGSWRIALVGAVASIIAMIPLGLVLLTSIAFAVGGVRLARQQVLIQELAAVEVLARVDIICLDKTGTLTEGSIRFDAVHVVHPPENTVPENAVPENAASGSPASGNPTSGNPASSGWRQCLGWFGADPNGNATARGLSDEFPAVEALEPKAVTPFSSERKWSAVSFGPDSVAPGTWVLGAPELVFPGTSPHTSAVSAALNAAKALAAAGRRTLVLAHSTDPIAPVAATGEQTTPGGESASGDAGRTALPPGLSPTVLLSFTERIRPDAARTLSYFQEQGVEVRILSGDDPETVAAVAREVGVHVEHGFDARNLPPGPGQISDVLEKHRVFGRVTPEQKKEMVRALHQQGHVVAMTGDGVNDALALKYADIGIAMNTGAAATKAVARLVLLDGRFDRLPRIVAEGRRVIANVERVSILYLSKTAYAIAISVIFGALLWGFPFLPRQLSVTDGITIGIPSFFLALMANSRRYRPGFLHRSLWIAVPVGLIVTAGLVTVTTYATLVGGFSVREIQGASVIVLSLIALWVLVLVSRPLNAARVAIILAMYAGLICLLTIPFVSDFFALAVPPEPLLLLSLATSGGGCLAVEVLGRIRARANAHADSDADTHLREGVPAIDQP